MKRILTPAQDADIARRYAAGASMDDLAVEYFCNRSTIYRALERAGVPKRQAGRTPEYVLGLYEAATMLLTEYADRPPLEAAEELIQRARTASDEWRKQVRSASTVEPVKETPDDRPDICTACFEDHHDACLGCNCNSSYHK